MYEAFCAWLVVLADTWNPRIPNMYTRSGLQEVVQVLVNLLLLPLQVPPAGRQRRKLQGRLAKLANFGRWRRRASCSREDGEAPVNSNWLPPIWVTLMTMLTLTFYCQRIRMCHEVHHLPRWLSRDV